ncbi:MAG: hypothetical protein WCI76_00145 [bacterium]
MKLPKTIFVSIAIFSILVVPALSLAETTVDTDIPDVVVGGSLVPCGHPNPNQNNEITNPCSFKDAITMINTITNFILYKMAIPICAIMFAYSGFLMVSSGGSSESLGRAKKIFTSTVMGLAFVAGAWLIVKTVITTLGYDATWIGF